MYFLHWDFSDGKLLPTCLVHYEQESYLSQEERLKKTIISHGLISPF